MDTHPITRIVHVVASSKDKDPTERHKIVAYDKIKGEAISIPRINLMRKLKYYRVDFDEVAVQKLERLIIEDGTAKKSAPIDIVYSIKCEEDQELKLVKAIKGSDQPGKVVDERILKTLQDAVQEKNDEHQAFLVYFPDWKDELSRRIKDSLREIGLRPKRVDVNLHPQCGDKLFAKQLEVRTRLRDYGQEVPITLNIRVGINTEYEMHFLLSDEDPKYLEEKIKLWTIEFFSTKIGITRLDKCKPDVEERLKEDLDHRLADLGRKIIHLDFQFEFPFKVPQRQSEFTHAVPCIIEDISEPVDVIHKVLVRLRDLGKWIQARRDDPIECLKKAISDATHHTVFNKTYIQVIKAFNQPLHSSNIEANTNETIRKIKSDVQEYAETIGYSVEQLISIPNMEPTVLQRDGLRCSIDQVFGLSDPRIHGRVLVDVFGQLPDLVKIERYLRPGIKLTNEVKNQVNQRIERILVKTTPHRFHTEFMSTNSEQASVATELIEEIKVRLLDVFKLEDLDISVRMGETELARRAAQLARGQHTTNVTFLAGSGELGEQAQGQFGAEDMRFDIRYAIDAIDGNSVESWYRFQARNYETPEAEVAAINRVLNDELIVMLNQLPVSTLRSMEFQRDITQRKIKERLVTKIIEDFGVVITVSAVVRRETETDDVHRKAGIFRREAITKQVEAAKELQSVKANSFLAAYEELIKKRQAIAAKNPDDLILKEYDHQLEELEKVLKPEGSHADTIAAPKLAPKLPLDKTWSIHEHLEHLSGEGVETKYLGMQSLKSKKLEE